jgi:predicted PurR-regulated permease PerM
MNSKTITYGILRAVAILVGIILLLWFLYQIQSVIAFIAIAAVISLIGRPMVFFLKKKLKFPNRLAVVVVLCAVLSIIIGVVSLFIPIIIQQSENIGRIDFDAFKADLNDLNLQIKAYLGVNEIDILTGLKQTDFIKNFDFQFIPNSVNYIFSGLGNGIIGVFSIIFISFFLLSDSKLLLNSILVFSNKGEESRFKLMFEKIKILLSRYFIGLTLQILVLFIIYTVLLVTFEVDNAVAIALICAFLNIVPYLGPMVAGILMALFVISSNLGADFSAVILPKLGFVMAGYAIAQLIDNFINQPLIFGKSVRSHPLEIFLIILIAGLLFGILGMVIAIPVYTAIKVIAKETLSEYKIVKKLTKDL